MYYRNIQFTCFAHQNLDFLLIENEPKYPLTFFGYGVEICPTTGRQHLQGYAEFSKKMYKKGIKVLFEDNGLHIELAINVDSLVRYNKKDGNYHEYGTPKKGTEWSKLHTESIYQIINERDIHDLSDIKELVVARDIIDNHKIELYEKDFKDFYGNITLTEIQSRFHDLLIYQNDRQITWIYDDVGGAGKSWFADYMISVHDAIILTNGKTRDLATYYSCQEYVIFDFSRTTEGRINFQIIEDLKNGKVFAPKYKSKMKFRRGVKVICLANFLPDLSALSMDRWDIWSVIHTRAQDPSVSGNTESSTLPYLIKLRTDRQTDIHTF